MHMAAPQLILACSETLTVLQPENSSQSEDAEEYSLRKVSARAAVTTNLDTACSDRVLGGTMMSEERQAWGLG